MTADNAPVRAQQPLLRPRGLSASAQLMRTAVVLLAAVIVDRLTRRGRST